ncbi:GNAT family N-acetyltransferase [Helicobacter sp. MIT 21-1697]|uniref:GNAT family N-acetyltransferase n=1 Tax=Helicobacter sp. MIT 21-1697 TaxID=2993733 RepID=UPI00224AED4F|nr:GNAT family N-acetyltransferase [Helicobacter sp. MIT 21-1697]MCX2717894.1 GNAT family N-acetyltransferase [Helicobacter sp. MIT 21-1697]
MISIQPYCPTQKPLWNAFNQSAKNGIFLFDRDYMDYHADRFVDNSLLFYEGEKLLALLPLNVEGKTLCSHQGLTFGGFVIGDSMRQAKMLECFSSLREYMKERGFERLLYKVLPYIYHQSPAQEDLYALFRNGAKLYRTDCSTTIDLRNAFKMSELRKRGVKKAKKEGIVIEQSSDFSSFVALVNEVLQDKHNAKAVHNAEELSLLYSRFMENIKLFVAKSKSEILAATLLFLYPHLIHTQYLAVNDKGREIGALDLLLKTLIDTYAQSKTYFDFGISTESNGTFLNTGLISQKEGFGGRTITHQFYELLSSGGGV